MTPNEIVKDGFVNGAEFLRERNERARHCSNCALNSLDENGYPCDYCAEYDPHDPTDSTPFRDVLDWHYINGKLVRRTMRSFHDTRLTDEEEERLDAQIDGEIEDAIIAKHDAEFANEPPNDGSPR